MVEVDRVTKSKYKKIKIFNTYTFEEGEDKFFLSFFLRICVFVKKKLASPVVGW